MVERDGLFIDKSLEDLDLRFIDLKQQLQSFEIDFTLEKENALVEVNLGVPQDSWSVSLIDSVDDNEIDFTFPFSKAKEFVEIYEKIKRWYLLSKKNQLNLEVEKNLKFLREFKIESLKDKIGEKNYVSILLPFLNWYSSPKWDFSPSEVEKSLNASLESINTKTKVKFVEFHNLSSDKEFIIPVTKDLFLEFSLNEKEIGSFLSLLILSLVRIGDLKSYSFTDVNWAKIVGKLSYPIVVFAKKDQRMVLHTHGFSKLGVLPSDCTILEDGQVKEISGTIYDVKKFDFDCEGLGYFALILSSGNEKNNEASIERPISSQELGIISSSIAHELNNPIAGVLASLTLLKLEDDFKEEELNTLSDMEEGAIRCRDLIRIFLGFSRAESEDRFKEDIYSSLRQSVNMLRFRMIESQHLLNLERETVNPFLRKINSSVMTMIFYLLVNEMITLISHTRLVREEQESSIKGIFTEFSDGVVIKIEGLDMFSFKRKVESLKLIQHLFDRAQLKLEITSDQILIKDNLELSLF